MDNSKSGSSANIPLRMLIAVDHSEASLCAARFACELAPANSAIRIVSVVPLAQSILPPGDATTTVLDLIHDDLTQNAAQALSPASEIFMRAGFRPETATIDLSVQRTDLVHAILDAAASWHADLIVVGAHQHQRLLRVLEGSVSEPLVNLCARPLLIVPQCCADVQHRPERILFAAGSVADAQICVPYGMRFATAASRLRAVCAVGRSVAWPGERPGSNGKDSATVLEAARQILKGFSGNTTTDTIGPAETNDDVAAAIVGEAVKWDADLLVMGMHSTHGLRRFVFGSVAHRVVRKTRTPLLLINMPDS